MYRDDTSARGRVPPARRHVGGRVGPAITLVRVRTRRNVIDYALQRRARLGQVRSGLVAASEACDAHPHLLLAAQNYGSPSPALCPVCRRDGVRIVRFVYGDELGQSAGQARSAGELERMDEAVNAVNVYLVEVCPACKWNHLIESFVIGLGRTDPASAAPPRRSRARR